VSATVFISYSRDDKDLLSPLTAQLKALEQAGLLDVWVDTRIDAGAKWYPEIEAAMKRAAVAVCLVSEYFLASDFCTKEEVPFLLKREAAGGLLIMPVLLSDCPWYAHRWIEERQMLPGEGQSVRTHFPQNPAAVFSQVAKRIHGKLADPTYRPPIPPPVWQPLAPEHSDITRLPETGKALFGREQELRLLDEAWASADATLQARILVFIAYGGVGKSTLVNHWLREMQRDHFRGATRVFGWTFYSQGVRDQMASADTFIAAALSFFGDSAPTSGSPWDKGDRLAQLVGAERALLVLDGLEPLQSGYAFERGKMRDPALESFLRGLTRNARGLCVITTREPVPDLSGLPGVVTCDLDQITPEAGRAILRIARVVGADAELEALTWRFGSNALTISLLGVYLYENDPARSVGAAPSLEALPGSTPLEHVLVGFERWLADTAEIEILCLLGFFDRPAAADCLTALRTTPPIGGLTDRVASLDASAWHYALDRLERLRLIRLQRKDSGSTEVDAHPLLREHFADQLRNHKPKAWREGHRRLYEYLKKSAPRSPETLNDLQPLYQAVIHGCRAGIFSEAFFEVFADHIQRGEQYFAAYKLGTYATDLATLACFFDRPWSHLHQGVSQQASALIFAFVAYALQTLGRLDAAIEPGRAAIEHYVPEKMWVGAARAAINLSEVELLLGSPAKAIKAAEQAIKFAEQDPNVVWQAESHAILADAFHQTGQRDEARHYFEMAEKIQKSDRRQRSQLYSLRGFRYCDFLLAQSEIAASRCTLGKLVIGLERRRIGSLMAQCRDVRIRAFHSLKVAKRNDWLLDTGLDGLTMTRASLYQAILKRRLGRRSDDMQTAWRSLEESMLNLHRSANSEHLPRGLLTRAWMRVLADDALGARADLDQAQQIAQRGSMKLHLADVHLNRARLFCDKAELIKARALIEECNYWRRQQALQDAEEASVHWLATA
jgi:tetratricopeptide (TPR) repeat protein